MDPLDPDWVQSESDEAQDLPASAWTEAEHERGRLKQRPKARKEERKRKRNEGKEYVTTTSQTKSARAMRPNPCKSRCPNGCCNASDETRLSVFKHYWGLGNYTRQRDWLCSHVKEVEVKRRRSSNPQKRFKTYKYFLEVGETKGAKVMVCKQFFLTTLDIGEKTVYYALANATRGASQPDQRGRHSPANKTPVRKTDFVKAHIESLPAVSSHYCRKESKRLYLEAELQNVSNLHKLYVEELRKRQPNEEPVSLAVYKRVFQSEYNLAFHHPKKDKCVFCEGFSNTPVALRTEELIQKYQDHLKEKEATYAQHKEDQEKPTQDDGFVCASFDLQKVLNTPCGNSVLLYYSRKYAVYNLTVYESKTKKGFCNLWGECDAQRGANEVGTVLYKWLCKVAEDQKPRHIVMYCDCCAGQNRNRFIVAMLLYAITHLINVETLELKYLLSGHTYMQVDSMHAAIEFQTRSVTVQAPSEWTAIVRNARKEPFPYEVEWLPYSSFLDWKHVEANICLKNARDENGKPVRWSELRQIKVAMLPGSR